MYEKRRKRLQKYRGREYSVKDQKKVCLRDTIPEDIHLGCHEPLVWAEAARSSENDLSHYIYSGRQMFICYDISMTE